MIIVTGGSGFIGSHLCRELADRGHKVQIIDLSPPPMGVDAVRGEKFSRHDQKKSPGTRHAHFKRRRPCPGIKGFDYSRRGTARNRAGLTRMICSTPESLNNSRVWSKFAH